MHVHVFISSVSKVYCYFDREGATPVAPLHDPEGLGLALHSDRQVHGLQRKGLLCDCRKQVSVGKRHGNISLTFPIILHFIYSQAIIS